MVVATPIQFNSTATKVGNDLFVPMSNINAGDLIIVFAGGAGAFDATITTITDTAGNTWEGGFFTIQFFDTIVWYTFANASGAITITVSSTAASPNRAAAQNYRGDIPPFAEMVFSIGPYTPSDASTYPFGVGTAAFSLAECFIATVMVTNETSNITGLVASDTGDTARNTGTHTDLVMWMFDRSQDAVDTNGGNATVMLKGGPEANSKFPLISLIFSRPLGTAEVQYQVKPGSGESHYNPAAQGTSGPENVPETNRPLTMSLAYRPVLAPLAMINVGVMPAGEIGTIPADAVTVTDAYGNTYNRLIYSPGHGATMAVALFQAIIDDPLKMPPVGSVFQVTLRVNPQTATDAVWQRTAVGVIARSIERPPTGIVASGFKVCDNNDPSFRLKTFPITDVPKDTYIFAFAAYPGGGGQDNVTWTFLEDYSGVSYGRIQFPFAITNDPREGPCAVMDKFAPSFGDYDAQIDGLIGGNFAQGGSIALIAMQLPRRGGSPEYIRRRNLSSG